MIVLKKVCYVSGPKNTYTEELFFLGSGTLTEDIGVTGVIPSLRQLDYHGCHEVTSVGCKMVHELGGYFKKSCHGSVNFVLSIFVFLNVNSIAASLVSFTNDSITFQMISVLAQNHPRPHMATQTFLAVTHPDAVCSLFNE